MPVSICETVKPTSRRVVFVVASGGGNNSSNHRQEHLHLLEEKKQEKEARPSISILFCKDSRKRHSTGILCAYVEATIRDRSHRKLMEARIIITKAIAIAIAIDIDIDIDIDSALFVASSWPGLF